MRQSKFIMPFKGHDLYCEISPCSWVYKGYGLQVGVALHEAAANGATVFLNDKSVECSGDGPLPLEEAMRLVARYLLKEGLGELRQRVEDFAKIMAELKAENEAENARMEAKTLRQDLAMRTRGYTHKVIAWIHGKGDDYQMIAYYGAAPTDQQLASLLKQSRVKTDYHVKTL